MTEVQTQGLLTPTGRLSYPHLFKPRSAAPGAEPKYSCTLIFDKIAQDTPQFKAILAAVEYEAKQTWPKGRPPKFRSPIKDATEAVDNDGNRKPAYDDGCKYISISTKDAPGVVDQKLNLIIDPNDIYAGCFARAKINVKAYDQTTNKGVAIYLQHIQKVKDGDPLTTRVSATQAFDAVDPEADSDSIFE